MKIYKNYSLKNLNSFKINTIAREYIEIEEVSDIFDLIKKYDFQNNKYFILGNGTNILLSEDYYDGLVLKNNIKEKFEIRANADSISIIASSGIDFQEMLLAYLDYIESHNYKVFSGLENLSSIPSSVGAAVFQNMGAYGIDQNDFLFAVEVVDLFSGIKKRILANDCALQYRSSLFKRTPHYFITEIYIRISLESTIPHNDYAELKNLENDKALTPRMLYNTVSEIRKNKLPSHIDFPNAGSFFKNPSVSKEELKRIQKIEPNIKYFESLHSIKLAAASLIELAGLKGYRHNNVGISAQHSLFIINYGTEKGRDITNFSDEVRRQVFQKFGIELEPEVMFVR